METRHIVNYRLLKEEIRSLKTERKEQEERIAKQLNEVVKVIQDPAPVLKNTLHKLAKDQEVRGDLLKVGIHYAGDFLVDTLIQKKGPALIAGLLSKLEDKTKDSSIGKIIRSLGQLFKADSTKKEKPSPEN